MLIITHLPSCDFLMCWHVLEEMYYSYYYYYYYYYYYSYSYYY